MSGLVRHVDVAPQTGHPGVFVGRSLDLGWGRVYGGQTMAQGLAACHRLVGSERVVHQYHCHFLRGGDVGQDVRFQTEELLRSRAFSVVHVRAAQGEKTILAMTASLQAPEPGFEHQVGGLQPEWGRPDALSPLSELMAPFMGRVPEPLRKLYEDPPLEMRPAAFVPPWDSEVRPPERALWVRAKAPLPEDARVHERILAYVSDWGMVRRRAVARSRGRRVAAA